MQNNSNHQAFRYKKALVLGELATSHVIATQLKKLGCESVQVGVSYPAWRGKQSLGEIRRIFKDFKNQCEGDAIIHPGTSLWAERSELPSIAEELGLTLISPPARVLSLFGNKLSFLSEAERLRIPHLVQSFDPMSSAREIENFVRKGSLKFPLALRAVRGGGRFSKMVIQDPSFFKHPLKLWKEQLRFNLGESLLFVEKYPVGARQILVPFVRYLNGEVMTFPCCDVSLGFQFRKLISLCPARQVDEEVQGQLTHWTTQFASGCGYVGVGVLEYLVDGPRAYLFEGSARLNTDFHLWEKVAGVDAVAVQWAAQSMMDRPKIQMKTEMASSSDLGVSLRVCAENPLLRLPQPGTILEMDLVPKTKTAEFYSNYQQGERISSRDSGLIGQLFSFEREAPLANLLPLLSQIWIAGTLQTNERFLSEILDHPWVKEEIFHIGFLDEEFLPSYQPPKVLVQQAEAACLSSLGSTPQSSSVNSLGSPRLFAAQMSPERWLVRVGDWFLTVKQKKQPGLSALVTGRVHSILFRPGILVGPHEPLLILESFGSLIPHTLGKKCRIQEWRVQAEDQVELGQPLADIEILEDKRYG